MHKIVRQLKIQRYMERKKQMAHFLLIQLFIELVFTNFILQGGSTNEIIGQSSNYNRGRKRNR